MNRNSVCVKTGTICVGINNPAGEKKKPIEPVTMRMDKTSRPLYTCVTVSVKTLTFRFSKDFKPPCGVN